MLADIDTAEPVLEPDGSASNTYALTVCPPRLLHPLGISLSLKLSQNLCRFHSLQFSVILTLPILRDWFFLKL